MNKNTTRVLAVAVLTGGFTIFGATAANAIDLPDLGGGSGGLLGNGGLLGTGIDLGGGTPTNPPATDPGLLGTGGLVDDLTVDLPVNVNGLNVAVLPGSGDGLALGDGLLANTGTSNIDLLSQLGIDTSGLVNDNDLQGALVGVPLNVSNTWVSILGTGPNGIVVVPEVAGTGTAELDGLIDGVVDVPIDISCTSVTVLSDYENECAGGTAGDSDGGLLGGDILGGDILDLDGDIPVDVDDLTVNVLDGNVLGDGLALGDDGVLVDLGDSATDVGTDLGLGDLFGAVAGAPIDLSDVWVSVLGEDPNGIVIVPDLTIDLSVLTGGLITSEVLAPISLDCVTVTVLSDYQRDCDTSSTEEIPTDPEEPTAPVETPQVGGEYGEVSNAGGDEGMVDGAYDACTTAATTPTADVTQLASAQQVNIAALAAAVLAGALLAVLLMLLGRRLGSQQQ